MKRRTQTQLIGLTLILLLVGLSASGIVPGDVFFEPVHAHGSEDHAPDYSASQTTGDTDSRSYDIHFETHPEPSNIIPDDEPVELLFEVYRNERPAKDVELSYRVYSPSEPFWFRTDFPVVEGTRLLSGTAILPEGQQELSLVLPIRGTYRVKATVRGPKGVTRESFSFPVSENPQEILNFSIFLSVLFLIGGMAGYFLLGRSADTQVRSWMILVLTLSALAATAPDEVFAHGDGDWDPDVLEQEKGATTLQPETELITKIFPQPVSVGEMLDVRYRVNRPKTDEHGHDHQSDRTGRFRVDSSFVHSEGGLEMVSHSTWFRKEGGSINVQLFDGAGHYLVSRFYRPTERYPGSGGHEHGEATGTNHESANPEKIAGQHGSHDHDKNDPQSGSNEGTVHESKPWEAESRYKLESGQYTVHFSGSEDPSMKWILLAGGTSRPPEIARAQWDSCERLEPGAEVSANGSCYELSLNPDATSYQLTVSKKDEYHLYTEHLPREFDLTIDREGQAVKPHRKFVTGKGEYLGQRVDWIELQAVQPPFDSIFKAMGTLLIVVGIGFWFGSRGPDWIG